MDKLRVAAGAAQPRSAAWAPRMPPDEEGEGSLRRAQVKGEDLGCVPPDTRRCVESRSCEDSSNQTPEKFLE